MNTDTKNTTSMWRASIPTASTARWRKGLAPYGFDIKTATLDEPEHGLTQDVLDNTDVLTWWGHMAHHEVSR